MSTPSLSKALGLDMKLGAVFVGNIIASIIYGITCLQTFFYFKSGFKDSRNFKAIMALLWILDTAHLVVVTYVLYTYMITDYGNPLSLLFIHWGILVQLYITIFSDLIIRCIFALRVWRVTGHNKILGLAILTTSIAHSSFGLVYASIAFKEHSYANLSKISYLMYSALANGVVADALIAAALCFTLSRSRTGFRKTDSLVNTLILYAINSCLLTTICAAACFITYAIWPAEFIFIGVYFCLNKIYFNSLLGTLNGRDALREKVGGLSDVPVAFSHATASKQMTMKDEYAMRSVGMGSSVRNTLVVQIDRHTEVRDDDLSI